MATIAVIQARMSSTRLPGKVLMDLGGQTMLSRVVRRLQRAIGLDGVLVATSVEPDDDAVVEECCRLGVPVCRGSRDDVLDRYYHAARTASAATVVRITADCPLLDPDVVAALVEARARHQADYASNTLERTYPRGLDVEVFTFEALERSWREAKQPHQREHVTPYIYEHPDLFKITSVKLHDATYGHWRWTVDTWDDLQFVRAVYALLPEDSTGWQDVVQVLTAYPNLLHINRNVRQKPLR